MVKTSMVKRYGFGDPLEAFSGEMHSRAELEMDSRRVADLLTRELPRGVGFAVFVFSFGEKGNLAYISNANRVDMMATIAEWYEKMNSPHAIEKILGGAWTPDGIRPDSSS